MMHGAGFRMINPGRDDTKDVQLSKGLVRRVFKFAKPYRG